MIISLGAAQFYANRSPAMNFYMLPMRIWEFLVGALISYHHPHLITMRIKGRHQQILSALGILLIPLSSLTFDSKTPYPSLLTIVPVLGSSLIIIFAKENTFVGNILSNKALVGIGLISYSLYLWHQPLFAFSRILFPNNSNIFLGLVALSSFIPAWITWRFIEMPFRTTPLNKLGALPLLLMVTTISALFFGLYFSKNPYGGSTESDIKKLSSLENFRNEYWDKNKKLFNNYTQGSRLLIIGDSYAQDFHKGLINYLGKDYKNLDVITLDMDRRCKNVLENTPGLERYLYKSDACGSGNRLGNSDYEKLIKQADLIIVRSYWDDLPTLEMPKLYDYLNGLNQGNIIFLEANTFGDFSESDKRKFLVEMQRTLNPSTILPYSPFSNYSTVELIEMAPKLMIDRNYIDIQGIFCKSRVKCNAYSSNGELLTPDGHHLTNTGKEVMLNFLFNNSLFAKLWNNLKGAK